MNESWVVYNTKTGKIVKDRIGKHSTAKKQAEKGDDLKVASSEWYFDNKDKLMKETNQSALTSYLNIINESSVTADDLKKKKKVTATDIMKMFKNKNEWGDFADQVKVKGKGLRVADTFYFDSDDALDKLKKDWSKGGHMYEYFSKEFGLQAKIKGEEYWLKAPAAWKKLTTDGVVEITVEF